MGYRLIITRPDGTEYTSSIDPIASRTLAGVDAMRNLSVALGSGGLTISSGKALGREVRDATLGKTVTHEPSGYRFRTEEF